MKSPITIPGWAKFQAYKRRTPPWIRLYRDILNKPEWAALSGDAAKLLVELWLLASESDNKEGIIKSPTTDLAWRLRRPLEVLTGLLLELETQGLIHIGVADADTMLTPCMHDAGPESESETETESEQRVRATRDFPPEFTAVWRIHPRGSKTKAFEEYRKAIAREAITPDHLIQTLGRYVSQELNERFHGHDLFRWIRDERWEEYLVARPLKPAPVSRDAAKEDSEREARRATAAKHAGLVPLITERKVAAKPMDGQPNELVQQLTQKFGIPTA